MPDLSPFIDATLLGIVGYCVIVTNWLVTGAKPFIEKRWPVTDTIHDRMVQISAGVFGVITLLVSLYIFDTFKSPQQVAFDIVVGIGVGAAAIGNYKLLTFLVGPITPVLGKVSKLARRYGIGQSNQDR
jgi:hypothetical protein